MEAVLRSARNLRVLQLTTHFDRCKTLIRNGKTVEVVHGHDFLLADLGAGRSPIHNPVWTPGFGIKRSGS